jgi:hypothetical protein
MSTSEFQDVVTSRAWRRSVSEELVEGFGAIMAEFFDEGCARRWSWSAVRPPRRCWRPLRIRVVGGPGNDLDEPVDPGAAIDVGERRPLVLDQFGSHRPVRADVPVHSLVLDVRRHHVHDRVYERWVKIGGLDAPEDAIPPPWTA